MRNERDEHGPLNPMPVEIGPLKVNYKTGETILPDGRTITLTERELGMLTAADSLDHKYKTHQEIAEQYNLFRRELGTKTSRWKPASPQVVRKRIFEIREKLGDHRDIIQGMFGAGYKIDLNYAISEDDNILED